MSIDIASPRSRRSLLATALGGLAAAGAATLATAGRVLAAGDDGLPLTIGVSYINAQSVTALSNLTNSETVFAAASLGGIALAGASDTAQGVQGRSTSGIAVHGVVDGTAGAAFAVLGEMTNPDGASVLGNNYATTGNAQGVQGTTDSPHGWANTGWARKSGTGLIGVSGADFPAKSVPSGIGVFGFSEQGRGGVFTGPAAPLQLTPSTATTHPASGGAGDLFVDKSKRLWFCKGGTTWKQLA